MSKKQLLTENEVRRFMRLANIPALGKNLVSEMSDKDENRQRMGISARQDETTSEAADPMAAMGAGADAPPALPAGDEGGMEGGMEGGETVEVGGDVEPEKKSAFEAAVQARISEEIAQLEEQYSTKLEEALEEVSTEMASKIDDYLNYCVEQWMKENEVAIEQSLRTEITEEFMEGMKKLFAENYIEIPEDKLNVIEELAATVEQLEEKLNAQINENIELSKSISQYSKQEIFDQVSEGLVMTQVEKLRQLAEGIDFDDPENYKKKLNLVKENYFPTNKASEELKEEEEAIGNNDLSEEKQVSFQDPSIKRYFNSIART